MEAPFATWKHCDILPSCEISKTVPVMAAELVALHRMKRRIRFYLVIFFFLLNINPSLNFAWIVQEMIESIQTRALSSTLMCFTFSRARKDAKNSSVGIDGKVFTAKSIKLHFVEEL